MSEVRETRLPGIGLRYDFACASGERIAVVSRRSGARDLVIYDRADPDAAREELQLTADEASTLADLLGGTTVTERLSELHHEIAGLAIEWITVSSDSPVAGKTIATAQVRTRTGASIVARTREGTPLPAPEPSETLVAGDVVVVVGTSEGVTEAIRLLTGE